MTLTLMTVITDKTDDNEKQTDDNNHRQKTDDSNHKQNW
jgi:hypothetical protein